MSRILLISVAVLAVVLVLVGCGAEKLEDHACPKGSTLTYENFGDRFFTDHCRRCHGGANGYSSRSFTSVDSIRTNADRIFVNAAGDNTAMPPGPDDPSADDRRKLADWLSCGAP